MPGDDLHFGLAFGLSFHVEIRQESSLPGPGLELALRALWLTCTPHGARSAKAARRAGLLGRPVPLKRR